MEDVPYEFIERVFAKLSFRTIEGMDVRAPLWQEVARIHKEKLQRYECVLLPSDNGLIYGFTRNGTRTPWNEKALTLDEFVKLDWRYHRVVSLRNDTLPRMEEFRLVGDQLAEIVEFVSQFNLKRITIQTNVPWSDLVQSFMNEYCKHDILTDLLEFEYSPEYEVFLLKQLKSDRLEQLNLWGPGAEQLRPHLEAFVCRPNFKKLNTFRFQCFDHEGIERIVAYWRSMEAPWTEASIDFGASRENLEQICDKLTWMEREPNSSHDPNTHRYVELRGDFVALVELSTWPRIHLNIRFYDESNQ